MNILKHPIYKSIYDLCLEIEKLPASEQATKCVVMASALEKSADEMLTERDQLAAKCAEMREAVNLVLDAYSFVPWTREPISLSMKRPENEQNVYKLVIALNNLKKHVPSDSCGKGWLSPSERENLEAKCAAKDAMLREVYEWCVTDNPSDIDGDSVKAALETEGKGWLSPEKAQRLREALRRASILASIAYDWDLGTDGKVEIDRVWVSCSDLRNEFTKVLDETK